MRSTQQIDPDPAFFFLGVGIVAFCMQHARACRELYNLSCRVYRWETFLYTTPTKSALFETDILIVRKLVAMHMTTDHPTPNLSSLKQAMAVTPLL